MQGTEVLLATAWLALRFAWPAYWVGYLAIDGLMAGAADARCASRGETVPPLASLNVAALAVRFNFFRLVAVVDVAAGRLAWRPSLFFSWCARVLAVVFLCFVHLGVVPSQWSVSCSVVAAIRAEWSKEQSSWLGHAVGSVLWLLDVAESAPLARAFRLSRLWCVRSWCAGCLLGSHLWLLVLWLINGCGRGIALMARPLCWPCFGTSHGLTLLMAVSWGCWLLPRAPPLPATFALLGPGVSAPCVRAISLACTSYRGFALMAPDGCSCGGCSTARCVALPSWPCLAAWMLLDRIAFSARPHGRLISCFTSYLHWANFSNPCFGLMC
ncbi:hypothetical protein V6N11_084341 [Hibiscus sabdariffa]|uniref:Uncharacterized protein n=1 Tax=Hibiscus sabdariffa TaxID=183260 RepID=A0ABR2QSU7_9ROSI